MAYEEALLALADPTRRRVLEQLRSGPKAVGAIAARLPVSRPAVSQHLRVLRDSGFTTVRPEGARRLYAVDAAPLQEVDLWLSPFRRYWSQRLDALGTELARGKRARRLQHDNQEEAP